MLKKFYRIVCHINHLITNKISDTKTTNSNRTISPTTEHERGRRVRGHRLAGGAGRALSHQRAVRVLCGDAAVRVSEQRQACI